MSFSHEITSAFPASNPAPVELRHALEFLEEHGCLRRYRDGSHYLSLRPEHEPGEPQTTTFHVPDPAATAYWTASDDPQVNQRLVIFLRTGADGSWAGLWQDNDGYQRIVHLGSGSGSTMLGILTTGVEDLLRLLAIGYNELCNPEEFAHAPGQFDEGNITDDYPSAPLAFQKYVTGTLGLSIPVHAADIVVSTPCMDAQASSDPFWNWLKHVRGD